MTHRRSLHLALVLAAAFSASGFQCAPGTPATLAQIAFPFDDQLSLEGDVLVRVLPLGADAADLVVKLDGNDVTSFLTISGPVLEGNVPVSGIGVHELSVEENGLPGAPVTRSFETIELDNPDECDVLNNSRCLYPFPSSHFLSPDPTKPSGRRLDFPAAGLPVVNGPPVLPTQFLAIDGFSPTPTIQVHFPAGVSLFASNAPRLIPPAFSSPTPPPHVGIRMTDERSLEADSPTVLLRASTGERVLHFVEMDARALGSPELQALIIRPGKSLVPGERYIVAIRGLVSPGGAPVEAEPAFAALRDGRISDIGGIETRRAHFEDEIFPVLDAAGIARNELIVAWDFAVQTDEGLTHHALSMRDDSFVWLQAELDADNQTFVVDSVEGDCAVAGTDWTIVRGTYEVPLFLTADPEADINSIGMLNVDSNDDPVQNGVTNPPFTIGIPCEAFALGAPPTPPLVIGHGLFGTGEGMIEGLVDGTLPANTYIGGATNWRGLSSADLVWVGLEIIGVSDNKFDNFPALPDRLKQGQINTVLLARMMKNGVFNVDPAFQRTDGSGVFPGPATEMFYYGISLGGIMGAWFAAMTPDIERLSIDVPAMNFAMLLQRSTQFVDFEVLLTLIGLTDPMDTLLVLSLNHEIWVRSEPAGYVTHITSNPLPGTNAKKILMTVAWLDKQVSNQASEILARSLEIPNLDASIQQGFPGIPDVVGPVDSAMVIYDTGWYDIYDIAQYAQEGSGSLIPLLANLLPSSKCDPHAARLTIPDSQTQLAAFLQVGGVVSNFCTGLCNGFSPGELTSEDCDPLAP